MNNEHGTDLRPSACISSVLIEKFAPDKIYDDAGFFYEIQVTNQAEHSIESIVLVESLLSAIHIDRSEPPSQSGDTNIGRWRLGPIPPRGTSTVRLWCSTRKTMRFRSNTSIYNCS